MTTQNNDALMNENAPGYNADPKIPGVNEPITNADEAANDAVTDEELELLDNAGNGEDDIELHEADLDTTDEDGDELNEGTDLSGDELDVPGSELDDADEAIGEEDEENNSYSEGADKEDS
ncbi:hypothetical protein BH11BAC3_BH11BAC3_38120 [soil metagenome]